MDSRPLGTRLLSGIDEWPESWAGQVVDRQLGERTLSALRPFLAALASSSFADTTLRRHFGNAWMLGGEIVRVTSQDPTVSRFDGRGLLLHFVDEEGGPLLFPRCTEEEQRSFDSTCRKLLKYLAAESSGAQPSPCTGEPAVPAAGEARQRSTGQT